MPRRPGPRVADSICSVRVTGAPTSRPCVSSNICRSAWPSCTRSTSPLSRTSPTWTKATAFLVIGASLSMRTMFPGTPMTRASAVEFGIFTHSLRDQRFENRPPALGLQLLPAADDVPASDVQHHGFEAECVVVLPAFHHVAPGLPQHLSVEGEHIPALEQLIERDKPGIDVAKREIGLAEVATDVFEPLSDADRGRARALAAAAQRRHDHAHVDAGGEDLANQGVGDPLHQLAVPRRDGRIPCLRELRAPLEDVQHPADLLGVLRLEHAKARLEPFERYWQ